MWFRTILEYIMKDVVHYLALGGMNKKLYVSLEKDQLQNHTPRLFHLSSISKEFKPVEILCPHRASFPTPFPFLQEDLYQVNQPGNSYE